MQRHGQQDVALLTPQLHLDGLLHAGMQGIRPRLADDARQSP